MALSQVDCGTVLILNLCKLKNSSKIGFGGGCHWCTEAVFQSLLGVTKVEQGYVSSVDINIAFSEAVLVHFDSEIISLRTLIEVHLLTHKSTSDHSMRSKYRSAVYTFSEKQKKEASLAIDQIREEQDKLFITEVLAFSEFKPSREQITNYYYKNPEKPFCKSFIDPKLKLLLDHFSKETDTAKVSHLLGILD
jgi:peptide-methionine (S)-S-oxide reductase